jgi:hypothetical protein
MKYLLMLYADEKAGAAIPPEQMAGFMGKMHAYQQALEKAGAFVATAGLSPTWDAKTIKRDADALKVHDGPYADTREQFGGYYIIEAPDMDRAMELAAQCPAATWGSVEIRPFHAAR